jgi:predicted esterase YcpF (UPF0227 family)
VNFFFHGLDSSHESSKYKALQAPKACINMDFSQPDQMVDIVLDCTRPDDIFVGHSFGALWALAAAGASSGKCLLINPSFRPDRYFGPDAPLHLKARYEAMYQGAFKFASGVHGVALIELGDEIIDQRPNIELLTKYMDVEVYDKGHHRFQRVHLLPKFVNELRNSFAERSD